MLEPSCNNNHSVCLGMGLLITSVAMFKLILSPINKLPTLDTETASLSKMLANLIHTLWDFQ